MVHQKNIKKKANTTTASTAMAHHADALLLESTDDVFLLKHHHMEYHQYEEDDDSLFDEFTIEGDITIDDTISDVLDMERDLNQNSAIKDDMVVAPQKEEEDRRKKDHNGKKNAYVGEDWDVLTSSEDFSISCTEESKYTESDWDVLSSVQSVMSMDTTVSSVLGPTYSAVVSKHHPKCNVPNHVHNQLVHSKAVNHKNKNAMIDPIMEHECSEYDDRDGYKFARGGKNALMFRGNPKHRKRSNGGKRRESRNYRKMNSKNHY